MNKISIILISLITGLFASNSLYNMEHNIPAEKPKFHFVKNTIIFLEKAIVYSKHDKKSAIIRTIPKNRYFYVLDTKLISGSPYPWYETKYGWVTSPHVFINKSKKKNNKILKKVVLKKVVLKKDNKKQVEIKKEINKILKKDNSKKQVETKKEKNISNKEKRYNNFIGVSIGLSQMNIEKNDINGNIILGTQPDTNGFNTTFEVGMRNNNYFYTVSYSNILYDDVELDNFLLSINRTFDYILNPYIGIVAGISFIELTSSHINSSLPKASGKEMAYGLQVGLEYPIINNISMHTSLQYLSTRHKTVLKALPAQAELNRKDNANLNIGFRYDFK